MTELIIVGDEAWTPEEYAAYRARRDKINARVKERRATDPEYRARLRANWRRYYDRHHKEAKAYTRDWQRRKRHTLWSDAALRRRIAWHRAYVEKYEAELARRLEAAA